MINFKHYTIFNKNTGEIVEVIYGREELLENIIQRLKPDEDYIEAESSTEKDIVDPQSKQVLKGQRPKPELPPVSYAEARSEIYPSVGEQMDMLWHAMDSGQIAKAEPFYSTIKAVKTSIPKTDDLVNKNAVVITNLDETP